MNRLRVQERNDLQRDVKTKALLNTDRVALDKYKEERERVKKMNRVLEEVENLKKEVEELRKLVSDLAEITRSRNTNASTADVDQ